MEIDVGKHTYYVIDSKTAIFNYLVGGLTALKDSGQFNLGQYKVSIIMRDPMVNTTDMGKEVPCIAINRTDDSFTSRAIGDIGGEQVIMREGVAEGTGKVQYSIPFTEVFEIRVWALTPEMRNDIYIALKKIVASMVFDFEKAGLSMVRFDGGKDEADHNYLPGIPVFWATFNLSMWNSLEFEIAEDVDIISKIDVTTKPLSTVVQI